jgi:cytochrome c oxidase assembly factor CtaG
VPLPLAHVATGPLEPIQPLAAGLAAALYYGRARTLASQERPVPIWRELAFYGGITLIVVTIISPVGHIADELLFVHMIEHLLLADLGALLIVLGLTGPMLQPVLKIRFFDRLRVLANPAIAFPIWVLDLYIWHLPVFYEAALRNSSVHALEHAMFIGAGINMWMPLFGPLPKPRWFGNAAQLGYILAVRLAGALLGNVFIWSGTDFYSFYAKGEAHWGISALHDQGIAGSVMMVEGSVLTICLFAWVFLKIAKEGEERQELIDFAGARGVALSEDRARRAVEAGQGSKLRERLEEAAAHKTEQGS